jgi:hypothetical protein
MAPASSLAVSGWKKLSMTRCGNGSADNHSVALRLRVSGISAARKRNRYRRAEPDASV